MAFVITAESLTKRFGKALAVEALDFSVPEGKITAFLGPNGAGKTTTIRMLLGLLKPTSGRCTVLGHPAGHPEALARIGALVEMPSLYEHLTGAENLEITRLLRNAPPEDAGRVLSLVGLAQDARRLVRTYSLGMRQRLGLALALIGKPSLLILDEPANGLDPAGIQEFRELIRRLPRETGVSIFLSSHLLSEVEQTADHLVIIHKGRLRYQGSMESFGQPMGTEIHLVVDRPDRACEVLNALGLYGRAMDGGLRIDAASVPVPLIAERLVGAGLELSELTPLRANLETRFLSLIDKP